MRKGFMCCLSFREGNNLSGRVILRDCMAWK